MTENEISPKGYKRAGRISGLVCEGIRADLAKAKPFPNWDREEMSNFFPLKRLLLEPPPNARWLFLNYAEVEIPVGDSIVGLIPQGANSRIVACKARIHTVTQQWGQPFDAIPYGWKTITLLDFDLDVPAIIENLPSLDCWGVEALIEMVQNVD